MPLVKHRGSVSVTIRGTSRSFESDGEIIFRWSGDLPAESRQAVSLDYSYPIIYAALKVPPRYARAVEDLVNKQIRVRLANGRSFQGFGFNVCEDAYKPATETLPVEFIMRTLREVESPSYRFKALRSRLSARGQ